MADVPFYALRFIAGGVNWKMLAPLFECSNERIMPSYNGTYNKLSFFDTAKHTEHTLTVALHPKEGTVNCDVSIYKSGFETRDEKWSWIVGKTHPWRSNTNKNYRIMSV